MRTTTFGLPGGFTVACDHRLVEGADTVALVHGFGSAKEHFRQAFAAAPLAGYGLVAMDLVGFGGSRGPDDFEYAMKSQAEVLLQALDRLEVDRFHLVAHSMGGLVALEAAELASARVPVFGVWSSGDLFLVEGQMIASERYVRGPWHYARIEGANHWLQLDAPRRFNPLLLEYLGLPLASA